MVEDFFELRTIVVKCDGCKLCSKNKKAKNYSKNVIVKNNGYDILFVLEGNEPKEKLDVFIRKVDRVFSSYSIAIGLQCSPFGEIPSPIYETYKYCNTITEDIVSKYKVVVCIGNGLQAMTQSADINTWEDFSEFLFNQTYFYTNYKWKKKTRIYPIPRLIEWLGQDNFRNYFVNKQFGFVKEYLSNYSEFNFAPYNSIIVEDCNAFLEEHKNEKAVAWDTETSNLNCFVDDFRVGCITMSFDGVNGYYLPFESMDREKLNTFFDDKECYFANAKYDIKSLSRYGIKPCNISQDVILLYHLLNTVRKTNSLKSLAWLIGFGGYDEELDTYISKYKIKNYLDIPVNLLYKYATIDAIVTYRLVDYAKKNLINKQRAVYSAYRKYVLPVIPIFMKMEINGMEIDIEYLKQYHNQLQQEIKTLEKEIKDELSDNTLEVSSNEQLGKALEKYGLPNLGRTKKGHYQTGTDILQQWKNEGYEIINKIERYRGLCKLDETFVGNITERNGVTQHLMSDGKVHSTFSPAMTSSWRSKSQNLNLQNCPKHGEEGKKYRKIFKCPEGFSLGEADFSGFQLRIACIYSQDAVMEDVFINRGGDLHSLTGWSLFKKDIPFEKFLELKNSGDKEIKEIRQKAKNQVNFPLLFASSPYVIYGTIRDEWSDEVKDKYIEENKLEIVYDRDEKPDRVLTIINDIHKKFFNTYPQLKEWIANQHVIGANQGYVDSWHGCRRHLPQMLYKGEDFDRSDWTNLCNISVNSPVQSFEAVEAYKALMSIDKKMEEKQVSTKIIGMVHDSSVYLIPNDEVQIMKEITKESMTNNSDYMIPIEADFSVGEIWGFGREL